MPPLETPHAGSTSASAGARPDATEPAPAARSTPPRATQRPSVPVRSHESFGDYGDQLEGAKDWVREHQKPAMLIAFATGVFLGVMMRS